MMFEGEDCRLSPSLPHLHVVVAGVHFCFPRLEFLFEIGSDLWVLVVEVDAFSRVFVEIEEEVHGAAVIDVLVLTVADDSGLSVGAIHAPEEGPLGDGFVPEEVRNEIDSVKGHVRRQFSARGFEEGGGEVHGDAGLRGLDAFGKDLGPTHEAGDADAALPERGFVVEKGLVAGPALTAVVTGKDNQGVVENACVFEFGVDSPDSVIDAFEHGLVNGATASEHGLLGDEGSLGSIGRLKRCVDGEVRHIHEERFFGVLADELNRTVIDEIREVLALHLHRFQAVAEGVGAVKIGVSVEVGVAEKLAEVLVETPVDGVVFVFVAEVPFSKSTRGVANLLEVVRKCLGLERQAEAVDVWLRNPLALDEDFLLNHVPEGELNAESLLPATGHEPCPRRRANGRVGVKIGQLHALRGDAVNIGGLNVGDTCAADISIAHVIDKDENDVGRGIGGARWRGPDGSQNEG